MRHINKDFYRPFISCFLLLALLAGCGSGIEGDSKETSNNEGWIIKLSGGIGTSSSIETQSAVTVIPTQTTDSNGNISVATSNTSKLSVTVNDTSSGSTIPISGLNVNITKDNENYYIYLSDPSDVTPPLPIGFNVNDVSSSSTKSIAKISAGEALGCGLQAGEAIFLYSISVLGEEIKVIVNLLRGKNILSIIENAPIAFKGTSNFQQLNDNSLTSFYLGSFTLKEAVQALNFYYATTKTILAISTIALTATVYGAPVAKLAGVLVATDQLLVQLESVIYCFYGFNDNYKFDWYIKYGSVLEPIPVDPNSENPVIESLTANSLTLMSDGTTNITCNAYDLNNNQLKYYWSVTGGNISGSGSTVNWTAPSSAGLYTISCNVSNGKSISSQDIDIEVIPSSTPSTSIPPTINFITLSSQELYPGGSFTITYNVTNPEPSTNYALLGASIGPSVQVYGRFLILLMM